MYSHANFLTYRCCPFFRGFEQVFCFFFRRQGIARDLGNISGNRGRSTHDTGKQFWIKDGTRPPTHYRSVFHLRAHTVCGGYGFAAGAIRFRARRLPQHWLPCRRRKLARRLSLALRLTGFCRRLSFHLWNKFGCVPSKKASLCESCATVCTGIRLREFVDILD